jgi:hypothetical protein
MAYMSDQSTVLIVLIAVASVSWIIPFVVYILATTVRRARESEHLAGLKQTMIEKGMSVEDIERVLRASAKLPEEEDSPVVVLAEYLGQGTFQADTIEEIVSLIRAADPTTQRTASKALIRLIENGGDGEQALATARGLCGPAPLSEPGLKDLRFTDAASPRHP